MAPFHEQSTTKITELLYDIFTTYKPNKISTYRSLSLARKRRKEPLQSIFAEQLKKTAQIANWSVKRKISFFTDEWEVIHFGFKSSRYTNHLRGEPPQTIHGESNVRVSMRKNPRL